MELLTKASYVGEVSEREKRNLEVAYRAACESMVLLKNENVLPLNTKKVALYGPGVTRTIKGGTGSAGSRIYTPIKSKLRMLLIAGIVSLELRS